MGEIFCDVDSGFIWEIQYLRHSQLFYIWGAARLSSDLSGWKAESEIC